MFLCGYDSNCWQIAANISTVLGAVFSFVGLIAIVVTLLAARTQLIEASKSRSITAFFEVYKLFETDEGAALRKFAFELNGKPEDLSEEDRQKLLKLVIHFSQTAYLIRKKLINLDDYLGLYWSRVLRLGKQLQPYIVFERKRRNYPRFAEPFEWLVQEAEKYRTRNYSDLNPIVYTNSAISTDMPPEHQEMPS